MVKHHLPLACVLLLNLAAAAQNPVSYLNDTGSPAYATTVPVENGFIDMSNGNLHLEFPLASAQQRGTLTLSQKLTYDSRIWDLVPYYPGYQWLPNNAGSAGWKYVSGSSGTLTATFVGSNATPCYDSNGNYLGEHDTYQFSSTYVDGSGTSHPTSAGITQEENWGPGIDDCGGYYFTTTNTPGLSLDGSGYTVGVDGSGNDYVLDSGGNEVWPRAVDRYGNYLALDSSSPSNMIDSTGRVPVIVTQPSSTVTYYDVLSPTGPISNNGTRVRYIVTTAPVSVTSAFGQPSIYEWSGTLNPVSSIQLPDGSLYSFSYDSYGELSSVTLPTGGTISYGYQNFVDAMSTPNRWLTSRTVGSNPAETFTQAVTSSCSSSSIGCQQSVTHHKPSGDESVYTQTLVNGAWTTGIAAYAGSASSGTQLTQMTATNLYTKACAYPCATRNYISSSLITTEILPNGSGAPQYTQVQKTFDSFSGRPLTTKQWDFMSAASTSTPPSGTPTRETDYSYTGANPYSLPNDISSIKRSIATETRQA